LAEQIGDTLFRGQGLYSEGLWPKLIDRAGNKGFKARLKMLEKRNRIRRAIPVRNTLTRIKNLLIFDQIETSDIPQLW